MTTQLAFDIDAMLLADYLASQPAWDGAPLGYHEEPRTPAELDAAWERWILHNGNYGCIPDSHMWHADRCSTQGLALNGHTLHVYHASTHCSPDSGHTHEAGELPGNGRTQVICDICNWRHISDDEGDAVEAWHDHAFPEWRSLPVVPAKYTGIPPRGRNPLQTWVEEHYPERFQQSGYPIITERSGVGTRHVPGRSPWGGYDLSDHSI